MQKGYLLNLCHLARYAAGGRTCGLLWASAGDAALLQSQNPAKAAADVRGARGGQELQQPGLNQLKAASSSCLGMQYLNGVRKGLPMLEILTQPLALLPRVMAGQHLALLPLVPVHSCAVGMHLISY